MALQYPNFTELYDKWFPSIYQCCFLLCSDSSAARQVTFQVFLRMGSIDKSFGTKEEEMYALFQWVIHDCENYFYRKPRRKPNQKRLTNQQESLITLLRFPFTKKAAFFSGGLPAPADTGSCKDTPLKRKPDKAPSSAL